MPKGSWVKVAVVARDRADRERTPRRAGDRSPIEPPLLRGVAFEPMGEVTSETRRQRGIPAFVRSSTATTSRIEYLWTVNGTRARARTGRVLPAGHFKRGDEIVLEVVANDGEEDSEPLISDPISVANARPRIVSTPSGFGGDELQLHPSGRGSRWRSRPSLSPREGDPKA